MPSRREVLNALAKVVVLGSDERVMDHVDWTDTHQVGGTMVITNKRLVFMREAGFLRDKLEWSHQIPLPDATAHVGPPPNKFLVINDTPYMVPHPAKVAGHIIALREANPATVPTAPGTTTIIKEIVKVPCPFCGALVEITETTCPQCKGNVLPNTR